MVYLIFYGLSKFKKIVCSNTYDAEYSYAFPLRRRDRAVLDRGWRVAIRLTAKDSVDYYALNWE
jgi:hypothetical protein